MISEKEHHHVQVALVMDVIIMHCRRRCCRPLWAECVDAAPIEQRPAHVVMNVVVSHRVVACVAMCGDICVEMFYWIRIRLTINISDKKEIIL